MEEEEEEEDEDGDKEEEGEKMENEEKERVVRGELVEVEGRCQDSVGVELIILAGDDSLTKITTDV